ncbi:MAG TPA: NAD(P)-dependent glycerol-3-phosphate dehydrogenase [Aliiroseovarius sp.]|nr:NAD(P)-dependent glycerol-3-phosphate dehydrogenase [Aliiroseovarius sp.]
MNDSVSILGAGAFGTALALSLARSGKPVTLWARDIRSMATERENAARLPGFPFPQSLHVTESIQSATESDILLLAVPMQSLSGFVRENRTLLAGKTLVTCCKGVDLGSGEDAVTIVRNACPSAQIAVLSGPGFAVDIARGLPTALTLASENATSLQAILSTETLRLYHSNDLTGVALGGALKNIVAIACGLVIGAGLGESARAALLTRGFVEMNRFAQNRGALPETLSGLSGLGDLVLTATSKKSRNYAFGLALGKGGGASASQNITIEGMATAKAVSNLAKTAGLDMPVTDMVVAVLSGDLTIDQARDQLFSRPLKEE